MHLLSARLSCGAATGLPLTSYELQKVHAAFNFLRSGSNIGKVVVCSAFSSVVDVELRHDVRPAAATEVRSQCSAVAISLQEVVEMAQSIAGSKLDADMPLMEAGVDSLGTVELRNTLQGVVGTAMTLPSTLAFDHPTARQLAALLQPKETAVAAVEISSPKASAGGAMAIGGLDALLPLGAGSMAAAESMLACGRDAISQVPLSRWDVAAQPSLPEPIASRVRHGGFVSGAQLVDNGAFSVPPAEAAAMDPQQRLLLEHGYAALHDASLDRVALNGSLTGFFLGIASTDFAQVLPFTPAGSSVYAATGSTLSIASGRVSYVLGLHGPCASYDTACSAALTAGHAGLRAMQMNECNVALVAGVTLMLTPGYGHELCNRRHDLCQRPLPHL